MRELRSPVSTRAGHGRKALFATKIAMLAGAMLAGPAQAGIIFSPTNSPGPGEQTIQFEQKFTGQTSFFGDTNKTGTPIEFNLINGAMNGETGIGTNGIGQSDIICTAGCGAFGGGGASGSQLTDLEINIGAGFGATDFIGNLDFGEGTVQISVTTSLAPSSTIPWAMVRTFSR